MRLVLSLLGQELFALSWEKARVPDRGEHDHTDAQVELAEEVPVGFVIPANPSVTWS